MSEQIIITPRQPLLPSLPSQLAPPAEGRVRTFITSLDGGGTFVFDLAPSEQDRRFAAQWEEAGVAQASPQFLEYKQTDPERRVIHFTLDANGRPGGVANSLEPEIAQLKKFTQRVPGKKRAHRVMFRQGEQRFKGVVEDVNINQRRTGISGGALQCFDCSITIREIPG